MTQQLGATVLVENKTGWRGDRHRRRGQGAPADGYTLLVTTTGTVMQTALLYTSPTTWTRTWCPSRMFPSGPLVVAVAPTCAGTQRQRNSSPGAKAAKVDGLVRAGSYHQMLADLFNRHYGSKLQTVNYRGETPMGGRGQRPGASPWQRAGLQHRVHARPSSRWASPAPTARPRCPAADLIEVTTIRWWRWKAAWR